MFRRLSLFSIEKAISSRLPQGTLRHRVATGSFWTAIGSGIAQGIGLVLSVITARLLGPTTYGELGILLSTAGLFTSFAGAGLSSAATKFVAEFRERDTTAAGIIIGSCEMLTFVFSFMVGVAVVVLSPWLCRTSLGAPNLQGAMQISALVMIFSALNSFQVGVLTGLEAFRVSAKSNLVSRSISFPIVVGAVLLAGLLGGIIGYAVTNGIVYVVFRIAVRNECKRRAIPIRYRIGSSEFRKVTRFSVPVMLSSVSFLPATWYATAMVAKKSGFGEIGVFNAANQWQIVILFLSNAVANLGIPMLANALPDKNMTKYTKILRINLLLAFGLAVVVAAPVALASKYIMAAYGPGFQTHANVLMIIVLVSLISTINVSIGQVLWSLEATTLAMVLSLLRAFLLLGATFQFAASGVMGLAIAYLTMNVLQLLIGAPLVVVLLRRQVARWSAE
jgi:O-antigen/teichoic acid export membrane protein